MRVNPSVIDLTLNAGPSAPPLAGLAALAGGFAASGLFAHPHPVIAHSTPPCSGDARPDSPVSHSCWSPPWRT